MATVAVHINRLREKLSNSTNKIETVWGAGYRFK
ncbi:MAG: helix-turn-helix domain-containing protein [Treponema sp.]|nr:helix-turn-helix domain-containing protein [Treponema sp.]